MQFSTKIEKACANKDVRYYLNGVKIDSINNRAMATNGHILAVIPFECETSGIVPLDAVKLSQKRHHGLVPNDDKVRVFNGSSTTEYDYVDGSFPDIDRVVPEKSKAKHTVTFNAKLLCDLAESLTDKGNKKGLLVTLHLPDSELDAIYIEPVYGDADSFGVLMPARGKRD